MFLVKERFHEYDELYVALFISYLWIGNSIDNRIDYSITLYVN